MGEKADLKFKKVYVRSIYTCAIPEMLCDQKKVSKNFKNKELIKKLKKGEPAKEGFNHFSLPKPIFNYANVKGSSYADEFWSPYYNLIGYLGPTHFPFEMNLQEKIVRNINWSELGFTQNNISKYKGQLRGRLYPYGAISLQFIEEIEFTNECTSKELISLLDQPISYAGSTLKQGAKIRELRDDMVNSLLEKIDYYITTPCRPQYVIFNPYFATLPKMPECWDDIATLLARSNLTENKKKYNQSKFYKNFGLKGQLILYSPYSALILTPNLVKFNGIQCLRERISNIAEIAAIQNEFTIIYKDRINRLEHDLKSKTGYPLSQTVSYFKNAKNGLRAELEGLKLILNFQTIMPKEKWKSWHAAMAQWKKEDINQLYDGIEKLSNANITLGAEVRGSIQGVLDTLNKIKELIPEIEPPIAQ
jgi:hypothetical protein